MDYAILYPEVELFCRSKSKNGTIELFMLCGLVDIPREILRHCGVTTLQEDAALGGVV